MNNHNNLIKYIESVKDEPFKWGEHNCCIFVNNCLKAYTGKSYMPDVAFNYNDMKSAIKALRSTKSKSLYNNLIKIFGNPFNVVRAMRGDIVYKNDGLEGPSIGMCMGNISYFVGEDGLQEIKTLECKSAWARQLEKY
jgi:hypothetical protein